MRRVRVTILLVFLATVSCSASDDSVFRLPQEAITALRDQPTFGTTSRVEEIFVHAAHPIDGDRILWLLGAPDYQGSTNSFLPITVDSKGRWEQGRFIDGRPSIFHRLEGRWLIVSQWIPEGTYPSVYLGSGAAWQEIGLPSDRDVDCCFEYLTRLCIVNFHETHLTFANQHAYRETEEDGEEALTKSWAASLKDIDRDHPVWIRVDEQVPSEASCSLMKFPAPISILEPLKTIAGQRHYSVSFLTGSGTIVIPETLEREPPE